MRVRRGWIVLAAVVSLSALAACGDPTISDLPQSTTPPGGGSPTPSGQTGTPTPGGGTPTPGAAPTITNVPSYATWDAQIRPLGCADCHALGSSGGLKTNPNEADPGQKKQLWFSALCNRAFGASTAGTQSYNPPTGRFLRYMSGNTTGSVAGHIAVTNSSTTVNAWLAQGGATTPPLCVDVNNFDLVNSH